MPPRRRKPSQQKTIKISVHKDLPVKTIKVKLAGKASGGPKSPVRRQNRRKRR